jgi:HEAT repeat protein
MPSDLKPSPMTTADDPLPDLVRALRSEVPADRLKAAKNLGRLGWLAREALPALIPALADDEAKVREAAAQAVGGMGPDALPTLSSMLRHPDKYVRRHAVWAMGKLGPLARAHLPALCAALKDADPRTASGAAQALGNMGVDGAEAVSALAEAMRGTNIVLCRLAAKALSQIGTPALGTLIAHLQHSDPFVRGESALAVGWMGPLARSAVPYLADIVREPRASLAHTPMPTLGLSGPRPGKADDDLDDHESPTPTKNPSPTGETNTPEESCRVHAAQALGRIGPAAAPALEELHEVARVGFDALRRAAQHSIRQIEEN